MINLCYDDRRCKLADVAELVDALDLGSSVFGREGSSPFIRIVVGSSITSLKRERNTRLL
jgi:hypothetical protein